MSRRLIVLEGLDGSGKATQTGLLCQALEQRNVSLRRVSFPDYQEESSALVKMYLNGELGGHPGEVNAFAASSFYAVDRFASYVRHWRQDYQNGRLIVADRYTTSNMVYQMTKLPKSQWDAYLDWVCDFEYNKMELPAPDAVFYLDMPLSISQRLLQERYAGDEAKKDMHEKDTDFLAACRESALYCVQKLGWTLISCARGGQIKSVEEIHAEIMASEIIKGM
ncbi:dTMP kinase [Clostridium minihomine]|uniref:dTMP kinase n=1 Tax=Clostridium minihomine TaxID=2045012 RepID=UPI000C76F4CA|nr:deoxynucleoside kinase [Clostridium minihomine]